MWIQRYDLEDPDAKDAYRILTHKQRQDLYDRFARECRLWEATLRLRQPADSLPVPEAWTRPLTESRAESSWQSRRREIEGRERRRQDFYARLSGSVRAHASAQALPFPIREAFLKLGVPAGSPLEDVRRAYRQLALTNHPDQQGDHDRMADLNRAYRKIVDHLKNPSH